MKKKDYKQPEFGEENFYCPHCNVLSQQNWDLTFKTHVTLEEKENPKEIYEIGIKMMNSQRAIKSKINKLLIAECQNLDCKKISIWYQEKMVYPKIVTAPLPNEDMPKDVEKIYQEARLISNDSPRAAAALLRVALEKLTVHLGETKGNLNTRIKNLKQKGLPELVIKSLDIVRINANEGGSHAGQISLTGEDNKKIVSKLFWLVNYIIEETITKPKEIESQFQNLPEDKIKGIENRDK